LSFPHSPSLASFTHTQCLRPCLLHSSYSTPLPPSHSGSLLLSQLDIPDVPLIRHTNVIRLLCNHPFSPFSCPHPELETRPVDSISQQYTRLHQFPFHLFGICFESPCWSDMDQQYLIEGTLADQVKVNIVTPGPETTV